MHLLFTAGLSNEVLRVLCQVLIHSLWLGLIAAVMAAGIVTLTKRSAAVVRYNLLLAVLIFFILSIVIMSVLQFQFKTQSRDIVALVYPTPPSTLPASVDTKESFQRASTNKNLLVRLDDWCNEKASLIMMVWFLLFLIKCVRLIGGLHYIRRLRRYHNYEVNAYWKDRLVQLAQKTGINRTIQFLESELIKVPAVIGFIKPVLLVPVGLLSQLSPEQVEAILLHELAHIHRRDFLVNLLQSFVETFFFFNPAVIWISSLIREEREACCDDMVIANIPQKNSYLQALVSFQELSIHSKAGAMALTGNQNYLLNRVRRMLTLENKKLSIMEKTVLLLSIIGITAFGFVTKEIEENATHAPAIKKEARQENHVKLNASTPVQLTKKPEVKKMKTAGPLISKPVVDTVPRTNTSKRSFPSLSSSTNNNGTSVVSQIEATDNEGKRYHIKRVDGQVTELTVNGTAVPQNQYGEYGEVIRQIDEAQRQTSLKKKQDSQIRKWEITAKRKEISEQKKATIKLAQKEQVQKMKLRNQLVGLDTLKRTENSKLLAQKNELRKNLIKQEKLFTQNERLLWQKKAATIQKAKLLNQRKSLALQEKKLFKPQVKGNEDVSRILSDLNSRKLVPDADNLSFSLTINELIVNGTKQAAELHQEFKEKYIQNSDDKFIYSKKGSTTSITINKE